MLIAYHSPPKADPPPAEKLITHMFWFQFKTKYGYIKVKYSRQYLLTIDLDTEVQKRDKNNKVHHELKNDLSDYFSGQKTNFNKYEVNYNDLNDFGKKVLKNTRLIPYGITKTYSQIAEKAGNSKAYRAAGNVLNKNTIPIIIPCHRVILKDGHSGGFSAGAKWKRMLLLLEDNKLSIDKSKRNVLIIDKQIIGLSVSTKENYF